MPDIALNSHCWGFLWVMVAHDSISGQVIGLIDDMPAVRLLLSSWNHPQM